jgi:hypothetical protein
MATDLRIVLPNRPGALLKTLGILADAGLNLNGFCGDIRPGEPWAFLHILVDDPAPARAVLEAEHVEITAEHEVDVFDVGNYPGALAEAVARYTEAGRNIEVVYTSREGRAVIGTEDMLRERYGIRMEEPRP